MVYAGIIVSELSHSLNALISRCPEVRKYSTGMKHCRCSNCKDYHWPLEDHECGFVIYQSSAETGPKLSDTVYAAHIVEHCCNKKTLLETDEILCRTKVVVQWWPGARQAARDLRMPNTERELAPESQEKSHGDDLGHQTSNHDIDSRS